MKKILIIAVALAFFSASYFCGQSHAEELTATITGLTGGANIIRASTGETEKAEVNSIVYVGDIVETKGESFATVSFLPDTYIEIASDSQLRITRHMLSDTTSLLNTRVDLIKGHISKALLTNLPPDAVFEISLSEYQKPEAEAYHTKEEINRMAPRILAELKAAEGRGKGSPAILHNLAGIVEVIRVGEVQALTAEEGMELRVGDIVKTGRDSYVTISFLPKTYVEVSGNAEVKIIRNRIEGDAKKAAHNTRIDVLSGHLSNVITQDLPEDSIFEVVLVDYIPLEAEPFEPVLTPLSTDPFDEPPSQS